MDKAVTLHGYWRSGCSWRVRIALNLKKIEYTYKPVHLVKDGGEQHKPEYKALNPAGLVPTLEIDDLVMSESMPICEYLEETRGADVPSFFPKKEDGTISSTDKFKVRRLCEVINAGTQPI